MKKVSNTDWDRLDELEDKDIDTTDIPELDESFFLKAALLSPQKKSFLDALQSIPAVGKTFDFERVQNDEIKDVFS